MKRYISKQNRYISKVKRNRQQKHDTAVKFDLYTTALVHKNF